MIYPNNIIIFTILIVVACCLGVWRYGKDTDKYLKELEGFYLVDWKCLNCKYSMTVKIKKGTEKMTALNETICSRCGCKVTGK